MNELESYKIRLLPKELNDVVKYQTFSLPNPSRIKDKSNIRLLIDNDQVYQFHDYGFKSKYLMDSNATGPRKITGEVGEETARSVFLVNEMNRKDGIVLQDASFEMLTKYDIVFNLISFYCQKDEWMEHESDYVKKSVEYSKKAGKDKFLSVRDYQDLLIDCDSDGWSQIPLSLLESKLQEISEVVEEGDIKYYKISMSEITKFLINFKILPIIKRFPESIKIPYQYPDDIKQYLKVIKSCQLIISLIPKRVYDALINDANSKISLGSESTVEISVKECFTAVAAYKKQTSVSDKEKKLLAENAMQIGLGNGSNAYKEKGKVIKKPLPTKKIVAVGRGAIDGFFKKKS